MSPVTPTGFHRAAGLLLHKDVAGAALGVCAAGDAGQDPGDPRRWSETQLCNWLLSRRVPASVANAFKEHLVNGLLGVDLNEDDLSSMGIVDASQQKRVLIELRFLFGAASEGDAGQRQVTCNPPTSRTNGSRALPTATAVHQPGRPQSAKGQGTRPSPYLNAVPLGRRSRPRSAQHSPRAATRQCCISAEEAEAALRSELLSTPQQAYCSVAPSFSTSTAPSPSLTAASPLVVPARPLRPAPPSRPEEGESPGLSARLQQIMRPQEFATGILPAAAPDPRRLQISTSSQTDFRPVLGRSQEEAELEATSRLNALLTKERDILTHQLQDLRRCHEELQGQLASALRRQEALQQELQEARDDQKGLLQQLELRTTDVPCSRDCCSAGLGGSEKDELERRLREVHEELVAARREIDALRSGRYERGKDDVLDADGLCVRNHHRDAAECLCVGNHCPDAGFSTAGYAPPVGQDSGPASGNHFDALCQQFRLQVRQMIVYRSTNLLQDGGVEDTAREICPAGCAAPPGADDPVFHGFSTSTQEVVQEDTDLDGTTTNELATVQAAVAKIATVLTTCAGLLSQQGDL